MLELALPLASLLPQNAAPYVALVAIGFGIGLLGHIVSSRWLITVGIILVFLGAFVLPVLANITGDSGPPPPRPATQ